MVMLRRSGCGNPANLFWFDGVCVCSYTVALTKRSMRFEWDDNKNAENVRKHRLDFSQGTRMFSTGTLLLVEPDVREEYG